MHILFPKIFKLQDILIKAFKKDENMHSILKNIFDDLVISQISITVMELESWSKGFKYCFSKLKKFFYNTEMKNVMCDKYLQILIDLT